MARVRFYVSFVASLVPCDMSGFMECSVHRGVSDLCVFYLCLSRTFVSRFVVTSLQSVTPIKKTGLFRDGVFS